MASKSPEAIARDKARHREWVQANRVHLREYMREYRKKNYERLELKRKCRLAGVTP